MMTALVSGAIIALIAANIFLFVQISGMRSDLAKTREDFMNQMSNLRDASTATTATQREHLETLKRELAEARDQATSQARSLSSQAKAEATARAEQLAKQIQEEEARTQQRVSSELSEVKSSAATANSKIGEVSTDVSGVKTKLSQTDADLQKTIAELKSARGDLGVQSGLIATNGKELEALKRLGERNYFEFKIAKSKQRQRVGDISVQLKKTDQKHNRYTIEVMADDKLTEKKDKNINEPVQFYTSKARQPYEIVVNSVGKDLISGYLSTPKEQTGR